MATRRRRSIERRVQAWWAIYLQKRRRSRASVDGLLTEAGGLLLAEDGVVMEPEGEG